jgi:two-component system, OmpR family, sensor histidine kinase VicK
MLQYAYESNERQIQVINDLLSVAQVDAGNVALKKENVDLVALITDVLQRQQPIFNEQGHEVSFTHSGKSFIAYADKRKLRMVLENIIENASKYTLPGKQIKIKLAKRQNGLAVSVADEGIGMSKKDLTRLFKKFSRIDNPLSVAVGGTGLGLYWAKKVIDLHGGSITVSSKLNQGSTFTIILPVKGDPN